MHSTHRAREDERRFQKAFKLHEKGDLAGAEVIYRKILATQPNHAQVLYLLGTLASQRGHFSDAQLYLNRALELRHDWPEALNNLGLAAFNLNQLDDAEDILRRALNLHPDYADALNNLAGVLEKKGQLEDAMALYQQTVALKPNDVKIHYNQGLLLRRLTRLEESALCFERALAIDPNHVESANTLATILKTLDRLTEAEHWLRRALKLQPSYYSAHNNLAAVLQAQDRLEEALETYHHAITLCPDEPLGHWNRAFIFLALGQLTEGWQAYEWRRPVFQWQPLPFPEWDGSSLTGKTLLVFAEQGLGDELLFASCFPDLLERAGHCLFECDPRLAPLYQRSFPAATVVGVRRTNRAWLADLPHIDAQIPAGSIARYLRARVTDFPPRAGYLVADPVAANHWRERLNALGPGLKVGITWRSGSLREGRHRNYSRLNEWGDCFKIPSVQFVNLQYDDCADELATARRLFGVEIHAFPELDLFNDLDGTAALTSVLDLVIAAGNAAGEIAATLGVPVWRLEPFGRAWTSLGTDGFPWHPMMRVFRQTTLGDWETVLQRVAEALDTLRTQPETTTPLTPIEQSIAALPGTDTLTIVREYLRAGHLAEARHHCDAHLATYPNDPVALDLSATIANAEGNPLAALAALRQAVAAAPQVALYHGHLAGTLAAIGQPIEGEAAYRAALRLVPTWAHAHNDLGNLLRAQGRIPEAERCYLSALRYQPDLVEAHNNLGTVLELQGRIADAEAAYRGALRLRPHFPEGWYNLGNCLGDLGRLAEAITAYREALALRPHYPQAQFYLGATLARDNQVAAAETAYRAALALHPTGWPEALNMLANLVTEQGRWLEAEAFYREALAVTPTSPELLGNLGNCLQLQERFMEAETVCREAIRLAPSYAPAWNNLGNALRSLGRSEEGKAAFREAIALDPNMAFAHSNLGNALREEGLLSEAATHDRRAVELRPDLAGTWLNLGNTLQAAGNLMEAESCFQQALDLGMEVAILSIGRVRHEQGRPGAAVECMSEWVQRYPDNQEMRWNLAIPLLALGDLEAGWEAYEAGRFLPRNEGRRQGFHHFTEWDGSNLSGQTVLVYAEQGVGDEILFASCLPDLLKQVGHCIIECDRRLAPLYRRSFPKATIAGIERDRQEWLTELVAVDAVDKEIPIGSLPRFLRRNLTDFPSNPAYLVADPARVAYWRERLAGHNIKVGITWRSRLRNAIRDRHYSRLADWGAIFAVPGIHFVNLQYDDCSAELAAAQKRFGVEITGFPEIDLMNDLDEAAALTANLDLVISAGNAAGELAAALGLPVWRIETFGRHWTSLGTDAFPWHPRVQLFRQAQPDNWREVLARIALALANFVPSPQPSAITCSSQEQYRRGLVLQERNELEEAALCYQESLRLDPDQAEAHNNLGNLHLKRGELTAAEGCYQQALRVRPDYVEAWNNLGVLYGKRRQINEASTCYQTALELRSDLFEARYNLANMLQEEGDPVSAETHFRIALQQGVDSALLWNGLGLSVRDQGRTEEALSCFAEAERRASEDVRIRWNTGLTHLMRGELAPGWNGYEAGHDKMRLALRGFDFPRWDGRYAPNATLLVYAEQGIGDEILFASCLPDLLPWVGRCIVECEPRLGALLARSFPSVEVYAVARDNREWLATVGKIDFQCPIGSIATYLRRHLNSFPRQPGYLLPCPEQRTLWRKRLAELGGGRLTVGISWRSRLVGGGRARFYSQLTAWGALFSVADVTFVNLQYDDCTEELAAVSTQFGVQVIQLRELDLLNDLEGVAALSSALDLVIAPPNSVAEIAAAVGCEVWRLDAALPNWLSLGTNTMPWHPLMRLFRQERLGDWAGVLKTVANTLATRASRAALNRWIGHTLSQAQHEARLITGQLFAQLVKPGAVVVQIGTHGDAVTSALAKAVGDSGLVIVFDERPEPMHRLQASILQQGFSCVHYGGERIGARPEELPAWRAYPWDLPISNDVETDSLRMNEPVPCRTLDSLELPACDLLIVDSEGRETEVLSGAWQTLSRHRPLLGLGRYRYEVSMSLIASLETRGYQSLAQGVGQEDAVLLAYPIA